MERQDKTMTFIYNCLTSGGATVLLLGAALIVMTLIFGARNWLETGNPQFSSILLNPLTLIVFSVGFVILFIYGLKTLYGQTNTQNKFQELKELIKTTEEAKK